MIPLDHLSRALVALATVGLAPGPGEGPSEPPPAAGMPEPGGHPALGALAMAAAALDEPPKPPRPMPIPAPPAVSPGTEAEARGVMAPPGDPSSAESSPRDLQPGAGEVYLPPPPIPPVPEGMLALDQAIAEAWSRPPLTLEQLEQLASQNNPTLKQAHAQVETAFGLAIQAGLWPNPSLVYFNLVGQGGTKGLHELYFSQPIITAGKRRINRARFLETTRAEEWNAMAVEYRVLNDVRIHYFHALGMQAIVEVQKELLQTTEDILVTTRESYNLGLANLRDLHRANAALQIQRLAYLRVQNMYRRVWQQLMAIVGVQMPFTPLAGGLEGDTTPLQYEETLDQLLEQSPLMQASYANLRFEQIGLKFERVQPWPNLQVIAGPGYHFPSERAVAQAELRLLEIPLWNWNQGNIRRANADVLKQQSEIRRVALRLQAELAAVYPSYLTALQHVENYQKVLLPELRRAYELALDSYEDDRNTWGDVLMAQRIYFMNRMAYVSHLMAWRQAEVLLVGYLLHGGLGMAPMPPMPMMGPNLMAMPSPPTPPFRLPAMMQTPIQAMPEMIMPAPNLMGQEMFIPPGMIAPP